MHTTLQTCHELLMNDDAQGALTLLAPLVNIPGATEEALFLYAACLMGAERHEEAVAILSTLVADQPGNNSGLVMLAECHEKMGDARQAIELLRVVINRQPFHSSIGTFCRLLVTEGQRLSHEGRDDLALPLLQEAATVDPTAPYVLLNLGNIATRLNYPADGERLLRQYLEYYPDHVLTKITLTAALSAQSRYAEAEAICRAIVAEQAGAEEPEALTNLGVALLGQGRMAEAEAVFNRAVEQKPGLVEALLNLGNIASVQGRHGEARDYYARIRATGRQDVPVMLNAGMALLRAGDWDEGWALYEQRFNPNRPPLHKLPDGMPRWDGTVAAGRRILLASEQGFGDSLHFFRYARLFADQGMEVGLLTEPTLGRLFQLSDPRVTVLTDPALIIPGEWDGALPIMSTARVHGTRPDNVPAAVPYLTPDPAQVALWGARVASLPGLRVGLVWAGGARADDPEASSVDRRRSIDLSRLDPLARVPGVSFVSLQIGHSAGQIASSPLPITDWTAELSDFADTAALIVNLDLVICVDTAVAHLAGGLGVPVFVLSRYDGCWRWLWGRDDTVWYPTMRLFRQPGCGDWETPVAALVDALSIRAACSRG